MSESPRYRFLIRSAQDGVIEVAWSQELDHHPVAVGTLHLRVGEAPEDLLASEAHAYIAEWQRTTRRTL